MALTLLSLVDILIPALVAILVVLIAKTRRSKKNYPPGPPGRFFFGNFFDFPAAHGYKKYAEWSKTYGDVVHLEAFGQHVVVLTSQESCSDLLDKRSYKYSDRALSPVMLGTNWPTWSMGFSGSNPHWKDIRRIGTQHLKDEGVAQFRHTQSTKAAQLVQNLLNNPKRLEDHCRTDGAATVMAIVYGYDVAAEDDTFVQLAKKAMRSLSDATLYPNSDILNEFKFLTWLPSYKKAMLKAWKNGVAMGEVPFNWAKKAVSEGKAHDSIVTSLLTKVDGGTPAQQKTIRDLAASLYVGGADSTPSVICSFIFFMVLYPDIQRRAQAEIDRVVGQGRLPTFADRPNLPYFEAVIREAFRCALVTPVGISHYAMEDDEYKGYFIPKGTIMMGNIWAVSNDERVYPTPGDFDPTRYLNPDGTLTDLKKLGDTYFFGFGRRKCPGRYVADGTAWITFAYLLASLDMEPASAKDAANVGVHDLEYVEGLIYQLKAPFECKFTPRSTDTRALISEALF